MLLPTVNREKAEQQLFHVELQRADSRRSRLHQLRCELPQTQEQKVPWELELTQSEQERKRTVEQHRGAMQTSTPQISQSETSLEALKVCRGRAEEEPKTDRGRLIQDLKDRPVAADTVQLQLQLDQARTTRGTLEKSLEEERARNLELQEEKEEVAHLRQEKQTYAGLAEQLSAQIVEMEEEICSLRDHLREVSSQLDQTSNLVLDLRTQLNAKAGEVDRLRTSSEKLLSEVQHLSRQLKVKGAELDETKEQLLHLQEALLDSKNRLQLAEENFEQEKRRTTRQLVEMEALVLAMEEVMDPASPHRFVEHETTGA